MRKDHKQLSDHCQQCITGVMDAQDVLSGKWKIQIISVLYYEGKQRFMDLTRRFEGIAPKVLSKELKDLELNHLVTRTVLETTPVMVEYDLTPEGKSLNAPLEALGAWGISYRKSIMKKNTD